MTRTTNQLIPIITNYPKHKPTVLDEAEIILAKTNTEAMNYTKLPRMMTLKAPKMMTPKQRNHTSVKASKNDNKIALEKASRNNEIILARSSRNDDTEAH
ncbi:9699_t:CDS:1 [Gigaspora margarita]|uniref:9699_t:CDS:1 n=1 Tax=Gigaspora margarita TaxID=4874 RepID=A0ABN7WW51_GIGMA|nr:9699_t:CDS:1 [Gigaspora margarita]